MVGKLIAIHLTYTVNIHFSYKSILCHGPIWRILQTQILDAYQ